MDKASREEMKSSLPFKLGLVSKVVFKQMNTALVNEKIPVLAEQIPILMVVYFEENQLTQQDIANVLQKDKSGILRSLKTLQKDGFLKIESDLLDKRKNIVSLTSGGKFVCDRIQALAIGFNQQIMEHFSAEEQKTFHSFLNRVTNIFQK